MNSGAGANTADAYANLHMLQRASMNKRFMSPKFQDANIFGRTKSHSEINRRLRLSMRKEPARYGVWENIKFRQSKHVLESLPELFHKQ
jgi:hypothetical protein